MDKKYSDAEQYSKHDRDSHEADNARILFLDYGFTADQIKRISETGYIFDWEGDARTDVSYCINHDLLPKDKRYGLLNAADMQQVGCGKSLSNSVVDDRFLKSALVEDRDLIRTAIVKFSKFYTRWAITSYKPEELDQALAEFRTRLYTANCVNIENTVILVMEDLK
jgi:hypothetical protein